MSTNSGTKLPLASSPAVDANMSTNSGSTPGLSQFLPEIRSVDTRQGFQTDEDSTTSLGNEI